MIFIDRSVSRGVADAVKKMRDDVLWLEDKFPMTFPTLSGWRWPATKVGPS
jgi:hypothetical protein